MTFYSTDLIQIRFISPEELYNGSLSQKILGIDAHDALLSQLASYQPEIKRAKVTNFYGHLVYYPPDTTALENVLEKINALEIDSGNASTTEAQLRIAKVLIDSSVQSKGRPSLHRQYHLWSNCKY